MSKWDIWFLRIAFYMFYLCIVIQTSYALRTNSQINFMEIWMHASRWSTGKLLIQDAFYEALHLMPRNIASIHPAFYLKDKKCDGILTRCSYIYYILAFAPIDLVPLPAMQQIYYYTSIVVIKWSVWHHFKFINKNFRVPSWKG